MERERDRDRETEREGFLFSERSDYGKPQSEAHDENYKQRVEFGDYCCPRWLGVHISLCRSFADKTYIVPIPSNLCAGDRPRVLHINRLRKTKAYS